MPRFLMCRPDYFGIEYEINPWMRLTIQVNRVLAEKQWHELYRVLTADLGAEVLLLPPVKGLPDLTFTANGGYVEDTLFISSAFKHQERQRETPRFEGWFREHGYSVHRLACECAFEGEGDALRLGDAIVAGYRQRSDIGAHMELARITGRQVLSVELVNPWFYHLDTCFAPLRDDVALYFPEAFDAYGRKVIQGHVEHAIAVSARSAERFACNALVVADTVVTNTGCDDLEEPLSRFGFHVQTVDLSEFIKSGGSAKCLVLRLDS